LHYSPFGNKNLYTGVPSSTIVELLCILSENNTGYAFA